MAQLPSLAEYPEQQVTETFGPPVQSPFNSGVRVVSVSDPSHASVEVGTHEHGTNGAVAEAFDKSVRYGSMGLVGRARAIGTVFGTNSPEYRAWRRIEQRGSPPA